MRETLLNIVACPYCQSSLDVSIRLKNKFGIEEGSLFCSQCSRSYPIKEGIPRFVSENMGSTQERFSFEWMRYPGSLPEDEEIFLDETQLDPSAWKDRWVLDAGCGMGRYTRVAHSLGANVVALDLGGALIRLKDLANDSGRLHLVQGDLLHLPLKKESFDIIYSVGVIHHTPSPRNCVKELTQRLKPSGKLTLWVYGTAGSYRSFKTNPLKSNRQILKKFMFLVWSMVSVREFFSDTLRLFTVYLPHRLLYIFCYPLAALGKIPILKYLTFSVHPLWRVRLQENFDWLAPPYQSHHTKEEIKLWFEKNGLKVTKFLPHGFVPKVGLLGEKR